MLNSEKGQSSMREQLTSTCVLPTEIGFLDSDVDRLAKAEVWLAQGTLIRSTAQLGLWIFLATVTMLFAAFTSAYMVRSAGRDWQSIPMPGLLWFNTACLLSSSITLEMARTRGKRLGGNGVEAWIFATALLGSTFFLGQLLAWRQLVARGVYLQTNPHSSFFYILTGLHGLHLLGGLLLLLLLFFRTWRSKNPGNVLALRQFADFCATYWHFLDGLWLYLFVMLFVW